MGWTGSGEVASGASSAPAAVRGRPGPLPGPAQLAVELGQVVARAGAGLDLLALQLAGQLVVPGRR